MRACVTVRAAGRADRRAESADGHARGREIGREEGGSACVRAGVRAGGWGPFACHPARWGSGVGEWVAAGGLLARTGVAVVGLALPAAPAGRGGSAGESGAWRDEDQYQARREKL